MAGLCNEVCLVALAITRHPEPVRRAVSRRYTLNVHSSVCLHSRCADLVTCMPF